MRNLWVGLAAAAVVASSPAAFVAAPAWAASWSWLNETTEKFAVEMPGTTTVRRWDQEVSGGTKIPTVEYSMKADGREWVAGTGYFGIDATEAQLEPALGAAIDGVVASDKGVQTWRRTVRVSGRLALEAEYSFVKDGAPWRGRVVATFGNQRMYSLLLREPARLPVADQERAAKSFKLL